MKEGSRREQDFIATAHNAERFDLSDWHHNLSPDGIGHIAGASFESAFSHAATDHKDINKFKCQNLQQHFRWAMRYSTLLSCSTTIATEVLEYVLKPPLLRWVAQWLWVEVWLHWAASRCINALVSKKQSIKNKTLQCKFPWDTPIKTLARTSK